VTSCPLHPRAICVLTASLALIGAACSSASHASAPPLTTAAAATTTTVALASYDVGTREETYIDATRPTARNGAYPGAPTRTLRTRFYFPTQHGVPARTGAPFPIVLFSHGWTGTPEAYQLLLKQIASSGFVVVAPAYPLSNGAAPGGATIGDLLNQPKDASLVLDHVLAEAKGNTWLTGFVDPSRIAAGGHSLGAFTTYGLVYNGCCRDARIKAAFVMSGIAAAFPKAKFFTGIDTPLLATHGDHDELVAYSGGRTSFDRANKPKYFMTILGGKHTSEELGGNSPKQQLLAHAIIDFLKIYLDHDAAARADLKTVGDTSGSTTLIAQS